MPHLTASRELTQPPTQHPPLRNGQRRNVRVRLRGINVSRKRLASGEVKTFYYAWRGGPRIDAPPGSTDFLRLYNEAHAGRKTAPQGVVFALVSAFKASADFLGLAPSTRRAYAAYLKLIEAEFGDMPLLALEEPKCRGVFKSWRDEMAATPRKADYAWTTLARVLSFAKDRGLIGTNPCEAGGRLYAPNRNDCLWGEADLAKVLSVASPEMTLALKLALWTGQRQGDLLALRWSDCDGSTIRIRQSKTGQTVVIPVRGELRAVLTSAQKRCPLVLTNSAGAPWTSDGFRASWRKLCARAGIAGLTFNDLRGSAVTRLSLAGATPQEVAGVTGHSIADVCAILDRHYLGDRPALADQAMRKLERRTKRGLRVVKTANRASNRSDEN